MILAVCGFWYSFFWLKTAEMHTFPNEKRKREWPLREIPKNLTICWKDGVAEELIAIREHHGQVFFFLKREDEAWIYKTTSFWSCFEKQKLWETESNRAEKAMLRFSSKCLLKGFFFNQVTFWSSEWWGILVVKKTHSAELYSRSGACVVQHELFLVCPSISVTSRSGCRSKSNSSWSTCEQRWEMRSVTFVKI